MNDPAPTPEPPLVAVEDLHVRYGSTHAVRGLSFTIARGEIYGFIGPNGAGKTTTLAVLSTLLAPHAGEVRIAGHDLRRAPKDVRRSIGRVPQEVAVAHAALASVRAT